MTEAGAGRAPAAIAPAAWPVQCPVDRRWLTDEEHCPECGSPTAALHALNSLAASLLARAGSCGDAATSIDLVAEASNLVPSTERFEVAAADALEQIGRPDLALVRVEAALGLAPRRADLQARAEALRNARPTPVPPEAPRRWGRWAIAAVALIAIGAVAGGAIGRVADRGSATSGAMAIPTPVASVSTPPPATPSTSPSDSPAPSPGPTTTPMPTDQPAIVAVIREALEQDGVLAETDLAVEQIGSTIKVSGPVASADAAARLNELVRRVAPGVSVDLDGIVVPPVRVAFVQQGDTLWSIAARSYGDPRRWPKILRANPRLDPANLRVGQRIVIP